MSSETQPLGRPVHLLVPVDFSEHSRLATRAAAAQIQGREGAKLTLLNVVDPPTSGLRIQTGDLHRQMEREAERQLGEWTKTELPDVPDVSLVVVSGKPGEEICEEARKRAVSLIVIATHGHTGLRHYLLGSVAETVVRHAPCSVLVVR